MRSYKPGCAPASPAAHLYLTARIRQDISAASFSSCKFLWCSDECVLLPFSTHNQNFSVMNSCVAALSIFSSDILTWSADSLYSVTHKIRGVRIEEYAYYVNKLRQKVGLETWIWRQIVTTQRPQTTNKLPPYATEWNPHENFLRTPVSSKHIFGLCIYFIMHFS